MRRIVPTLSLILTAALHAEVACPPVFSDHMVLQRDRPVAVWGTAAPGETVTVEFGEERGVTAAAADGRWKVHLPALAASSDPRTLTIRGNNTLSFSDVLVGEVWFCSGQSNMEKPLGPRAGQKPTDNYEAEIRDADHPHLRLFHMPQHGGKQPNGRDDAPHRPERTMRSTVPTWVRCTPESVVNTRFSATAYFFGREIQRALGVPVGLIHASFGGTMIEAWMPRAAFEQTPALRGLEEQRYHAWVEGVQATELFQSMVAPLAPYTVRGFLWYQGEANCMNGDTANYAGKQRALVTAWRDVWQDEQAPFLFAQLAPFNYSKWDSFPRKLTPNALPLFWEAQANALDVPYTGMIVTTDLAGDATDIHPTNKRDVGLRFARLALHETYKRSEVVAHGPEFARMRVVGTSIEITFRYAAGGLKARDGTETKLTHFIVAGGDRQFVTADAIIVDDVTVVVSHPDVVQPVAVRFGWHETAAPNLVNGAGLPARPFRTDAWPVQHLREEHPEAGGTAQ